MNKQNKVVDILCCIKGTVAIQLTALLFISDVSSLELC